MNKARIREELLGAGFPIALVLAFVLVVSLVFPRSGPAPASAQVSAGGVVQLLPSTAISSNSTGTPVIASGYNSLYLNLNCSAVPVGGAPTGDFYIQTSPDVGATWRDIAHTQFTTATAVRFMQLSGLATGAAAPQAASDGVLAGETCVQGPFGDRFRVKWIFSAGGSSGSYTVAVTGIVK
jgi:hypothetical protein